MCVSQIIKCAILKYLHFISNLSPKNLFFRNLISKVYFWPRKSASRPKNRAIRHQDHQNRIRNGEVRDWKKYVKSAKKGNFCWFYPFPNFGIFRPILMILVSNFIRIGSGSRFSVSEIEYFNYATKYSQLRWEIWEKMEISQNCGFYDLSDTYCLHQQGL